MSDDVPCNQPFGHIPGRHRKDGFHMAKITLITGGAGSGKSRWAASYFAECDNVLYMCIPEEMDPDIAERIRWSNEHNYVEWDIMPGFNITDQSVETHKFFIFDDVAYYVSEAIKKACPSADLMTHDKKKELQKQIVEDISDLVSRVQVIDGNMIIITIDPGFSVMPLDPEQKFFRDVLNGVNQRIAHISSEVYMSISGIQYRIK